MIPNNGSVALALLALALITLSFQLWRNWQLRERLLQSGVEKEKKQFSSVSEILEQERSRISAELHDELGTLLSIIALDLELLAQEASSLSPYGENRLIEIKRNMNQVIDSIRTNIWNLSTQMFDQVDIAFVVRELCHKIDRHRGTHVTFMQSGIPFPLSEKYKLNLFRIIQELLTNALKHSSAWNISVHMHWDEGKILSITIEDDGVSYLERKDHEGRGMINISNRVMYIGAAFSRERLEKGNRMVLSLQIP